MLYISQGYQFKKKILNQSQKISAWKMPIFLVTLIQAVLSKTLRLFYKIFFCLQNTLKKSASSHYYEPRWTGRRLLLREELFCGFPKESLWVSLFSTYPVISPMFTIATPNRDPLLTENKTKIIKRLYKLKKKIHYRLCINQVESNFDELKKKTASLLKAC